MSNGWKGPERRDDIEIDRHRQEIAIQAGREGAAQVLMQLGINLDDGDSFRDFGADLAFLRRTREQSEKFNIGAKIALLTAFLTAIFGGFGWFLTFIWPPKH